MKALTTLTAIITMLSLPLMILCMFGGIGAGIWLVVLRDWLPILIGIVLVLVATRVFRFIFIPASFLAAPASRFAEKGKSPQSVCLFALAGLYSYAVIGAWSCGVLFVLVKGATAHALFSRVVWSYGVAIQPLAYTALEEYRVTREDTGSLFATFFAHLAYLITMLLVIFSTISLFRAGEVLAGFVLGGFVVQMAIQIAATIIIRRAQTQVESVGNGRPTDREPTNAKSIGGSYPAGHSEGGSWQPV